MRISKIQLKQIIQEELSLILELYPPHIEALRRMGFPITPEEIDLRKLAYQRAGESLKWNVDDPAELMQRVRNMDKKLGLNPLKRAEDLTTAELSAARKDFQLRRKYQNPDPHVGALHNISDAERLKLMKSNDPTTHAQRHPKEIASTKATPKPPIKGAVRQGTKQGLKGPLLRALGPIGMIGDLVDIANPEGFYAQAGEATKGAYTDLSKRAKEWWNPEKAEEKSGGDFEEGEVPQRQRGRFMSDEEYLQQIGTTRAPRVTEALALKGVSSEIERLSIQALQEEIDKTLNSSISNTRYYL